MSCLGILLALLVPIFLLLGLATLWNKGTEDDWNNGHCPTHEIRYELKAAGNHGLKYYACPECGLEVKRY